MNTVRFHGMKRFAQFTALLLQAALVSSCALPYTNDRGRDAMDIFTVTAGLGAGAKARAGPLHFGLFGNVDHVGLRGGAPFVGSGGSYDLLLPVPLPFENSFVSGLEAWDPNGSGPERHKDFFTASQVPLFIRHNVALSHSGNEIDSTGSRLNEPSYPYFTQVEVAVGLGGTIRLGFNPGELLDFFLGWFTIDIFNDDLGKRKSNQELEATGEPEP